MRKYQDIEQDYEIEPSKAQVIRIPEVQVSMAQTIEVPMAQVTEISTAHTIEVPTAHTTEIPTAHAIEIPTAQATEVFKAQATDVPTSIQVTPQIQNRNKVKASRLPKLKSQSQPYPSVIAPFKPPCTPNSPLFTSYGKRRKPLSPVNNIIIQLPPGASSQSYD